MKEKLLNLYIKCEKWFFLSLKKTLKLDHPVYKYDIMWEISYISNSNANQKAFTARKNLYMYIIYELAFQVQNDSNSLSQNDTGG